MKDYSKQLIKEYKYWTLGVHSNQGYLGRCVLWCKREDANELTDATTTEQTELFMILQEARQALAKAFAPDWFNYSFLGNEMPHLHCHIVPRYRQSVRFMNKVFEDVHFGHNYKTDASHITSEEVLYGVRDQIKKFIL